MKYRWLILRHRRYIDNNKTQQQERVMSKIASYKLPLSSSRLLLLLTTPLAACDDSSGGGGCIR